MKRMSCLFFLALLNFTSLAHAGKETGGGDVVILPNQGDDSIRLADPWLLAEAPANPSTCKNTYTLPPAVLNELGRVAYIFSSYDDFNQKFTHSFLDLRVLNPSIHYCLVEELPKRKACEQRMDYAKLPNGAKVIPAACTDGWYTWVVKDLVQKMPIREQARLYVHEGLRRTNTPEETIADVTDGLDLLLRQYNEAGNQDRVYEDRGRRSRIPN